MFVQPAVPSVERSYSTYIAITPVDSVIYKETFDFYTNNAWTCICRSTQLVCKLLPQNERIFNFIY